MVHEVEDGARLEAAARQVVRRRQAQRLGQLPRPARRRRATRNKAALIWEGEPGDRRTLTYWDLYVEVQKFANVLKKLGVKRGDRVAIYMPLIPEVAIAMLACTRIGAIHSVVFGGFSSESLRDRINDSRVQGAHHRRRRLPSRRRSCRSSATADKALEETPVDRARRRRAAAPGRGRRRSVRRDEGGARPLVAPPHGATRRQRASPSRWTPRTCSSSSTRRARRANRRASSTRPAAISSARRRRRSYVFDLKDDDVFWCTADVGWVTGHSYLVYGPLANGATCVMYEGAPDWPEKDRFWEICETLRRDDSLHRADGDSRVHEVGRPVAGEARSVAPPPARLRRRADQSRSVDVVSARRSAATAARSSTRGGRRRPARSSISPLPGITETKPGSATTPLPGYRAALLDANAKEIKVGGGLLALTKPWPSMLRTIWGDDARYVRDVLLQVARPPRPLLPRRRRQARRRRLLLDPRPRRRRAQRRRPSHRHDGSRVGARRASGGRRGGGRRQGARAQGPGARGVRHAARRLQAQRPSSREELRNFVAREDRRDRQARRHPVLAPTCRRRDRARSCGACCATSPKVARSATRRRWPTRTSSRASRSSTSRRKA